MRARPCGRSMTSGAKRSPSRARPARGGELPVAGVAMGPPSLQHRPLHPPPAPPAGEKLPLSADPSALKFARPSLQAKAGTVTIDMTNPAPIQHDVSIEGQGVDKQGKKVAKGGPSAVTADLKPGTYTFYC